MGLTTRARAWLRVPAELDQATEGQARTVYNLLLAGLIGCILLTIVGHNRPAFPSYVVLIAVHLVHLPLVRAGHTRVATFSYTACGLAVITGTMIRAGGLALEGGYGYILMVLITGLALRSGRVAIATGLGAAVGTISVAWLEQTGAIGGSRMLSPVERQVTILAGLVISATLVAVAARAYQNSRDQAIRSEAQLADLVRSAPDPMIILQPTGDIEVLNPAAEELTGLDAATSGGLRFARIIAVHQRESFAKMLESVALGDGPGAREVKIRARGTQAPTWVEARATRTLGRDAAPRIHLSLRDLTTLKQTEAARTLLEDQLQQSQRLESLGRLAAGIAHDFNNYLTVILGNATCADSADPADADLAFAEITEAANRASQLTSQLLTFGRFQPAPAKGLEINARVRESEQVLQILVGDGITLKFDYSPLPLLCRVDPAQFDQVLLNLVSNARDASPESSEIALTISQADASAVPGELPAGDYLKVSVRDYGTGISPEIAQHLFEPFFTTKQPGNGTGLGLSTVHGIVTQNGGAIRVDSRPGEGSCFHVFLPRTLDVSSDHEAEGSVAEARGSLRILLVEDNDGVRTLLRKALELREHQVAEARNGVEALSILRGPGEFDLVVTDASMPKMSGSALIDALASSSPDLPVILISGNPEPSIAGHHERQNVHFLAKPFSPTRLIRAIDHVLPGCV